MWSVEMMRSIQHLIMWILNIVVWPKQSKRWNTYKIKTPGPTVCPRWAINSSLLLLLASIIVVIWAFIGQKDQPDAYKLKITILLFWNKQKQNIHPINPLRGRIERQKTTKRHKNKSQTKTPNRLGICQKIYRTEFSGERILHTENA